MKLKKVLNAENITLNENHVPVKNRKELSKLIKSLKEQNIKYNIQKSIDENFRYTVSYTGVLNENKTLTEAPDKYGLPTDDELDLEKSNRINRIEQDYANKKSDINKKRVEFQNKEQEFIKVCDDFKNNHLSKLQNI